MLDMLAAFAHIATCHDYIRPELTDVFAIKSGRHPIREKIHTTKFVPNDAYATQQSRFQIITGCNMSGKSTYIRMLAMMTVMAQIGSYVPAEYASFPMVHQLFARVCTTDDIEGNVSTFAVEMREMAFILRNIEPRSMVIIDELGRGTSTSDGLAIAVAISEALVESRALVWFVTHFYDLTTIMAERNGVLNLHLAAEISQDASKMTMLYKIVEGPVTNKFYGLALARLVDLPPTVLENATNVSEKMNQLAQRRHSTSKAMVVSRKRNLILSLREQLLQARNGSMDSAGLGNWLKKLQDDFTLRMSSIDEDLSGGSVDDSSSKDEDEDHDEESNDDDDNDDDDQDQQHLNSNNNPEIESSAADEEEPLESWLELESSIASSEEQEEEQEKRASMTPLDFVSSQYMDDDSSIIDHSQSSNMLVE